jgi:hypothetical protein
MPPPPKAHRTKPPKTERPKPPRLAAPRPPERTAARPQVIGSGAAMRRARRSSGRESDSARVSVSLGPDDLEWLDAWAAAHRPPITARSEAIRRVIADLRGRRQRRRA